MLDETDENLSFFVGDVHPPCPLFRLRSIRRLKGGSNRWAYGALFLF